MENKWTIEVLLARIDKELWTERFLISLADTYIDCVSRAKHEAALCALETLKQFVAGRTIDEIEAIARDPNHEHYLIARTLDTRYLSRSLIREPEVLY
jgi:hypothetical protein